MKNGSNTALRDQMCHSCKADQFVLKASMWPIYFISEHTVVTNLSHFYLDCNIFVHNMPFLIAFIFCAEIHLFSLQTAIDDELQPDLSPFSILISASIQKSLIKQRSQNIQFFNYIQLFPSIKPDCTYPV